MAVGAADRIARHADTNPDTTEGEVMGWTIPRVKPPKDPPPCECPLCKPGDDG